jgi:hypothetical protein
MRAFLGLLRRNAGRTRLSLDFPGPVFHPEIPWKHAGCHLVSSILVCPWFPRWFSRFPRVEVYTWSPSHDQRGMLRPSGTSSADR